MRCNSDWTGWSADSVSGREGCSMRCNSDWARCKSDWSTVCGDGNGGSVGGYSYWCGVGRNSNGCTMGGYSYCRSSEPGVWGGSWIPTESGGRGVFGVCNRC